MFYIVLAIHVSLCVALVFLVLVQQGKGADLGAISGGSSSVFGAGGATAMVTKVTTGIAIGFMITSVLLSKFYLSAGAGTSVGDTLSGSAMEGVVDPQLVESEIVEEPVGSETIPESAAPSGEAPAEVEPK